MKWSKPQPSSRGEYQYKSDCGLYTIYKVWGSFKLYVYNPNKNGGYGGDDYIDGYEDLDLVFMLAKKHLTNKQAFENPDTRIDAIIELVRERLSKVSKVIIAGSVR